MTFLEGIFVDLAKRESDYVDLTLPAIVPQDACPRVSLAEFYLYRRVEISIEL
jgi:hypothetical protein